MNYEIATNPEQSKRLQACGVKPETADMYLSINICEGEHFGKYSAHVFGNNNLTRRGITKQHDYELAWSLERLLSLLPASIDEVKQTRWIEPTFHSDEYVIEDYYGDNIVEGDLTIKHSEDFWILDYDWNGFIGTMPQGKTLIEATVQMVELLYANGIELNNLDE